MSRFSIFDFYYVEALIVAPMQIHGNDDPVFAAERFSSHEGSRFDGFVEVYVVDSGDIFDFSE